MKTIYPLLMLGMMMVGLWSACSKDNETDRKEETQENKIREIIPRQYLDVLKVMGMPVHEGTHPPDITGIYLVSPLQLQYTNIENDNVIGYRYTDGGYNFYEQSKNDFSIKVASKHSRTISVSTTAVISGSGNAFTVYAMAKTKSTTGDYSAVFAYLYSGIMEGTSIKDLKIAFINVDNSNGGGYFIEEGQARITHDGDNISERISSLDDMDD